MEIIPINQVKPNPNNPRLVKDEKFEKLIQSIIDFPEMSRVRPLVINKEGVILGGNMRWKAMRIAGWKEVPVEIVDWSEEKQKEFVLKDNITQGDWDWDKVRADWGFADVRGWGLDLWEEPENTDYSSLLTDELVGDMDEIQKKVDEREEKRTQGILFPISKTIYKEVFDLLVLRSKNQEDLDNRILNALR